MNCWWFKKDGNNFGDIICPNILTEMTGEEIVFSNKENCLVTIGSVAFYNFNNKRQFWGSGAIDTKQHNRFVKQNVYHAVRGPLTRKRIIKAGGECPEVYGDPSMLLPIMFPKDKIRKTESREFTFLPHWQDLEIVKKYKSVKESDVKIVDIMSGVDSVLSEIVSSNVLLTSSLHGLIVGESYGVPTLFVEVGRNLYGGKFKFHDYFNSTQRGLYFLDNKDQDNLDLKKCLNMTERSILPRNEIVNFLKKFPYEIKNEKLKRLMK
jgi:pyruvyltransferase